MVTIDTMCILHFLVAGIINEFYRVPLPGSLLFYLKSRCRDSTSEFAGPVAGTVDTAYFNLHVCTFLVRNLYFRDKVHVSQSLVSDVIYIIFVCTVVVMCDACKTSKRPRRVSHDHVLVDLV